MATGAHIAANTRWRLQRSSDGTFSWEAVHAAILMDIRHELQLMNLRLQCPDFIAIPRVLHEIRRNTTRKRRRPRAPRKET